MMQTGMVKQNLNSYRGCLDGTELKQKLLLLPYLTTRLVCLHQLTIAHDRRNVSWRPVNANSRLNDTRSALD